MKIFGAFSFAACLYGILAAFVLLTAPVADAAANPLLGTWKGTSYEQSSGKTWAMTFVLNSDNTYSSLDASTDGKGSNLHSGTYSYTSTAITITVTSATCTGEAGCIPTVGTTQTFSYTISGSGIGSTATFDGNVVTKTSEPSSNIPASERQVLLDLYASANGAGWTNNTGWGGAAGTECTWYGVTCDTTLSHITEINLNANNLAGTLPSISGLTHIQVFRVRTNQLTGSIPSVSGLTSLIRLAFRQNQFTGSLPSLSGLTSLQIFTAGDNHLTGQIPHLSDLTALYDLGLENNQLSGPIPALPASFPAFSASAGYGAYVCSNSLTSSGNPAIDAAWNTATGTDWLACQNTTLYTLSVSRTGDGSGSITSDTGGISCGASCWADYAGGTSVTLTATPASGSYFTGWGGACSGTGACVVTMSAARSVTANFKPVPFVATTTSVITATSATITTTIAFNAPDVGKSGAVYVTSWAPANGLTALGILSAHTSRALSVTVTNGDPYSGGKIDTRQESLAAVLATADPNAYVLVQLTSTGWQLVVNGQLIPYASGVLGDAMSSLSILNNANPSNLLGAQFCVGYGTDAAEMIASGRMLPVADIPGATVATNGSCNVAANPYKGLWYNPAESGWGMSVTQHDSINFVALYTYDQSAQPVWYVMSNCPMVTAGSCTGDIYKVTGGTAPSTAWSPSLAVATAGTGTLTFSDANNGKFDFTLNGVTGSKTIERQLFSAGTSAQTVDYTDLWWNANESGWGISLTQDMGMIFAAWYTYDAANQPVWYVASSCPLSGSGCTGDVYKVSGGTAPTSVWAANLAVNKVGSVTFAFSDSGTGTMSYTIDGVSGSKAITRQAF